MGTGRWAQRPGLRNRCPGKPENPLYAYTRAGPSFWSVEIFYPRPAETPIYLGHAINFAIPSLWG